MTTPVKKRARSGAKAGARRQEVLAVAGQLIAEKGYERATVRDIADRAGILSGSLYHHFDSKESMVEELLRGYLDKLIASYEQIAFSPSGGPKDTLQAMFAVGFTAVVEHPTEITILDKTADMLRSEPRFEFVQQLTERIMQLWVGVISTGQRNGAFREDLDAQVVYRMLMASIFGTVHWYRPGNKLTMTEITDQVTRLYLTGLAAD